VLSRDALESSFVVLHLWIVCERCPQLAEDPGEVCIGGLNEAIVGPLAVATCGDEASAAKIREVPRNLWLIRLEDFNARADTELIVAQEMNKAQSRVIGQCFEQNFEPVAHLKADYDQTSGVVSSRPAREKIPIDFTRHAEYFIPRSTTQCEIAKANDWSTMPPR